MSALLFDNPAIKDLLLIFAKAPVAGEVKTRLIPAVSRENAARLHEAFIRDILSATKSIPARRTLACAPTTAHPLFESLKKEGLSCLPQEGAHLGERMKNALSWGFAEGFSRIVMIGSDAPSLPAGFIQAAFDHLGATDLVLGPCCDGGYYLMGLKRAVPDLFEQMPWGSEQVLTKTLERAEQSGLSCRLLPFWYDVDRPADLGLLSAHLKLLSRQGKPLPKETMSLIQKMKEGF